MLINQYEKRIDKKQVVQDDVYMEKGDQNGEQRYKKRGLPVADSQSDYSLSRDEIEVIGKPMGQHLLPKQTGDFFTTRQDARDSSIEFKKYRQSNMSGYEGDDGFSNRLNI